MRHVLRETDSWNLRLNWLKFPANLRRRSRFWVERFKVTRTAIEPDKDATCRPSGCFTGNSASSKCVGKPTAEQCAQPQHQAISAPETFAVLVYGHRESAPCGCCLKSDQLVDERE